jgi:hypothetical protein
MSVCGCRDAAPGPTFRATGEDAYDTAGLGAVRSVVAADLDGDGLPELIHPAPATSEVHVRRNEGQRAFGPVSEFPAGQSIDEVQAVDLDGDGHTDVLARGELAVSVLFGDGSGRLAAPVLLPVGESLTDVLVGDCDGDGRRDVVATRFGGYPSTSVHGMSVFLQTAPRAFSALPELTWQGAAPLDAALGDVTGDGDLDVVFRHWNFSGLPNWSRVSVGRGDGRFDLDPPARATSGLQHVLYEDIDGDGVAELVGSGSLRIGVSHYLGAGVMVAGEALRHVSSVHALSAADADGDGRTDVAAVSYLDGLVTICRADGNGGFDVPHHVGFRATVDSLAIADLDADGLPDLVAASGEAEALLVRYNGVR